MSLDPEPCTACKRTDWITRVHVRGVGWICGRCLRQGRTIMLETTKTKGAPP